jgi:hypothetical protein
MHASGPGGRSRRAGAVHRERRCPQASTRADRRVFARRPDGLWLGDGIQKIHFWAVEPEECGVLTSGWPGDPAPDRSARRDGLATVDTPCDAGDVGGIVGQEEGHGCGDLLGSALTAKGDCRHRSGLCPLLATGEVPRQIVERRVDSPRADAVHQDALGRARPRPPS